MNDQLSRRTQRRFAVSEAVSKIRQIEYDLGVTPDSLAQIKNELIKLAEKKELFPTDDFPPPPTGDQRPNYLYLISEDEDHRFALYVTSSVRKYSTATHNHQTWAVIVGLHGTEPNRLFERTEDNGIRETQRVDVSHGTGLAFMPDDLHALDVPGVEKVLNFHMYGLGLPQLAEREYYNPRTHSWHFFPTIKNIEDAR